MKFRAAQSGEMFGNKNILASTSHFCHKMSYLDIDAKITIMYKQLLSVIDVYKDKGHS